MRPTTCPSTPLPVSVLLSHSCQPHHTTTSPPKWWWHWQWVWPDTCRPWWPGRTAWTTWTPGTSRYCNWPLALLGYDGVFQVTLRHSHIWLTHSSKLRNNVLPNVHYFHYCVSTSTQMNLTQSGCLFLWETSCFSMLVKNPTFCCYRGISDHWPKKLSFTKASGNMGSCEWRKTGYIDWYAQSKVQDCIEASWRLESNASVQHNKSL